MKACKGCVATLALLGALVMVGWYGFAEPPWLSYRNLPFPLEHDAVAAGQPVLLRVVRCNADDEAHTYTLTHRLLRVDAYDPQPPIILPSSTASIAPGCMTETSAANVVPKSTPSGRYVVEDDSPIKGTFRSFRVHGYSEPFTVTP